MIDLIESTVYSMTYLSVFVCVAYRQILNMLTLHQKDLKVMVVGLRALALLLKSGMLNILSLCYDIFMSFYHSKFSTIKIRNYLVELE